MEASIRQESCSARPYGPLGLAISTILILAATIVLTLLTAVLAFGIAGLALGWQSALERVAHLSEEVGAEAKWQERAGIIVSLVAYAGLSAAVLGAARLRGGAHWRDLLGWHAWHPLRGARLFWLLAAATLLYGFGADALVSYVYPPSRDWITLPSGALWAGLLIVLAVLFAPVTEELFFRGWLYTGLRPRTGAWIGILVTALLFATAHWEKTHLYALVVFPVGVMLGVVREKTASLKASITLHAIFNGAASIALLLGQ